jgi:nitric oxide reductase NorD protein
MSHHHDGRSIAVMVLLDLSESLNQKAAPAARRTVTILELSQEAVSLLAWAIDHLGDPCAIAGFHSNTRHEVRFQHIKGFSERWDDTVKAGWRPCRRVGPRAWVRRCATPAITSNTAKCRQEASCCC